MTNVRIARLIGVLALAGTILGALVGVAVTRDYAYVLDGWAGES